MAWPRLLVLVRHAESVGNQMNPDERASFDMATYDYPLTEKGQMQALITGAWLNKRFGEFDIYYASYYRRSKETMRLMYPAARIYEDPRLAEGQRGIWHTMTLEQIKARFPEEIERKEREGLYHYRPLGGENWPDMELRIHSMMGTWNRDCEDKSVLVVMHGHWGILFQRLVHHFSIDEAMNRYHTGHFENASVTIYGGIITNDDKSRLVLVQENFVPWKGKLER